MARVTRSTIRGMFLAGAAAAAVTASGAFAQANPGSPIDPAAQPQPVAEQTDGSVASDGAGNQDIVVTAQKRSERLQDVPASVSVLSTQDLTKQGVVRFEDYATRVPGLTFTSVRSGQAQVTLRGITTGAAQSASSTGYYVDEAPIGSVNAYTGGSSTTPDLDPSDLAQIEVLKGPQGTLYGAGAVGGLLKFVTAQPDFDDFGGRVSGGITNAAHGDTGYSVRGMLNIPLVRDKMVLRVSGFRREDPGFIDNVLPRVNDRDLNGARLTGFRGLLAMKLGDNLRLDIQAIGQDTLVDGTNTVDVDAVTLKPTEGDLKQRRFGNESSKTVFRLYNATARLDLGDIGLVSSTTYQHTRFRQNVDATRSFGLALAPFGALVGVTGGLGIIQVQQTYSERWVQELRADATGIAGGLFDAQLGVYYTHEDDQNRVPDFTTFNPATGAAARLPLTIIQASIITKYEEYSVFGNATLHLGEQFDVLGGVRYSHDDQDYAQDYRGALVPGGPLQLTGKEKKGVVTWLVTPRFRIDSDNMIYGRVATGYRPGGPNAVPPTVNVPNAFRPDRLTSYEIGYKGTLLDRMVTLDAALFYTDWNDVQVQTSAGGFNFIVNGGAARSQGGEATLRITPTRGLNFGINASYTDAKLTQDAPSVGGRDGDRLPYVPRFAGSATAEYSVPVSGDFNAVIAGGVNRIGSRVSDYSNRFPKRLDGYTTVDLRAGVDNGAFSLSVFAKNLTDERGYVVVATQGLAPSNTPGAFYGASVIQPRVIGAEAAIRF